jgi:hypothetical protein
MEAIRQSGDVENGGLEDGSLEALTLNYFNKNLHRCVVVA